MQIGFIYDILPICHRIQNPLFRFIWGRGFYCYIKYDQNSSTGINRFWASHFAVLSSPISNIYFIPIYWRNIMQINCTCGNIEKFSNKMENFEVHIVRNSVDSKTLIIAVVCKLCGEETEQILLGN